jgi:hypothetical protein
MVANDLGAYTNHLYAQELEMKSLGITPIKEQSLTIDAVEAGPGSSMVIMSGVLTHRDPGPVLTPFFERLHNKLVDLRHRSVRVDIRELKFMNSASFKHVVSWIKANDGLPADQRYTIQFVLNPAFAWQMTSIHALRCFSNGQIVVEGEASR